MLRFGTDGWRAVISEGFTEARLREVGARVAQWARKQGAETAAIGYDLRFASERFAEVLADTVARQGLRVYLTREAVSTPALAFFVREQEVDVGLMLTASHNPYMYHGLKVRDRRGMVVSGPELLEHEPAESAPASVERSEMWAFYEEALRSRIREWKLERLMGKLVVDYMWGVLQGRVEGLLPSGLRVVALRNRREPRFGGGAPEPVPARMAELRETVLRERAMLGVAFDGDGDRIALVDDEGKFVLAQEILPMLADFLCAMGMEGGLGKTLPTSDWVLRVARTRKREVVETPVGFRHLSPGLEEGKLLIAGEESGGIGVRFHLPERDALMTLLLVLWMLAERRERMAVLRREFRRKYGNLVYRRRDFRLLEGPWMAKNPEVLERLRKRWQPVEVRTEDGWKFRMGDGAWVMIRESGTEPVLRLYGEAERAAQLQAWFEEAGSELLEAGAPIEKEG